MIMTYRKKNLTLFGGEKKSIKKKKKKRKKSQYLDLDPLCIYNSKASIG